MHNGPNIAAMRRGDSRRFHGLVAVVVTEPVSPHAHRLGAQYVGRDPCLCFQLLAEVSAGRSVAYLVLTGRLTPSNGQQQQNSS